MGKEIERKFLVRGDGWRAGAKATRYRQGYLCADERRTVRVRVAGDHAYVTIKGRTEGASRDEYEYEVPVADAAAMLDGLCERPLVEKTRHVVVHDGTRWEVDEFEGENAGLVVAEVELTSEAQAFTLPPWAGAEVTGEARYYNAMLSKHPFSRW